LATPPNADELEKIINKLGITAGELVRKSEPIYKEKYLGKKLTNKQWIKAMVKYPILIERPIIIKGKKAIIGRPVERILELL
jgi:arsenate reductase